MKKKLHIPGTTELEAQPPIDRKEAEKLLEKKLRGLIAKTTAILNNKKTQQR